MTALFKTTLLFCLLFLVKPVQAITVYYSKDDVSPAFISTYIGMFNMRSIAEDLAELLTVATGKPCTAEIYTGNKKGISLLLDPAFMHTSSEAGTVEYDGEGQIIFKAHYVTGISYSVYSWLQDLGFRFSLPGKEWTTIPRLKDLKLPKKNLEYYPAFHLRTIYASGGMSTVHGLDETGKNEKEWWIWYRRNRMGCDYIKIGGHIGELFNITHKTQIEKDSLILAPVNGKRHYDVSGKLDPTYPAGVQLFTEWIVQEYLNEQQGWPKTLPLKKYFSVDPGDGLNYCHTSECKKQFISVSDQMFSIANIAAQKIKRTDPRAGVSTMAYTERADTPTIAIEPNIHVMIVPTAFQDVTTPAELMIRWRRKTANISQYDFLNIGVWAYDQPFFDLNSYTGWLQFLNKLKIEGMSFEASMSKFASGYVQYCILQFLNRPYVSADSLLSDFCEANFKQAAGPMEKLFKKWYYSDVHLRTNRDKEAFDPDELAECIEWVHQAQIAPGLTPVVKERIFQVKAYMVYLCYFYELNYSQEYIGKARHQQKAEAVLDYCWKIYKLNILHNSQMNDLLKTLTPDPDDWNMKTGDRYSVYNKQPHNEILEAFEKCRKAYPFTKETKELSESFFITTQKHSADSIFISSMDEEAFGHFNYPVSFYNTAPSSFSVSINHTKSKNADHGNKRIAVVSCESGDYSFIKSRYLYQKDTSVKITFVLPRKGFYRLMLSYYDATPAKFVLYPEKQLFYIHKRRLLMNGMLLQPEQSGLADKGNAMAFYNTSEKLRMNYPYTTNINPVKLFTISGKNIPFEMNNFQLSATVLKNQFVFYTNQVYRWPVTLTGTPPYFFFLRK